MNFRLGGIGRSLLTGGDQLEGRYLFALPWDRLQLFDVRYGLPIGLDGGRLSFLGQAVWQQPPATFNGQSIYYQARSLLGRIQYSYPIVRHLGWTLMALGMLDVIDVDYNIAGIGIPGDSLRVLRGGVTTTFRDGWKGTWGAAALASSGSISQARKPPIGSRLRRRSSSSTSPSSGRSRWANTSPSSPARSGR